MANDNNSLPDILELLLRVLPSRKAKTFEISPELRISKGIVEGEDNLCFEVALKRTWLDLDLVGLDPIPGSRFGEPVKDNEAEAKRKTSQEVVKQGGAHGKIAVGVDPTKVSGSLSLGAEAKATAKTVQSTTSAEKISHFKVKARPNLKWEVTESVQLDELDGTYLQGEPLCKASAKNGANARTVYLTAFVKQRDVILRLLKEKNLFSYRNPTQEKLLKILIAKALSGSNSGYNGIIEFSHSEVELEDQHRT